MTTEEFTPLVPLFALAVNRDFLIERTISVTFKVSRQDKQIEMSCVTLNVL